MIIENLANAFVSIETKGTKVVCDPWITDGIYEGSWHIEPPLEGHVEKLRNADFVAITHIHADHFDPNALALTRDDCVILVPDIYPNRTVTKRKLPESLYSRIEFIPVSERYTAGSVTFEFIPPMNRYGHKIDRYEDEDTELTAIDTGIIVDDGNNTAVLLADNFPYHLPSAGTSLERMKNCSVVMFPYNACADDYPVCYDNLNLAQKLIKALQRNLTRVRHLTAAFEQLKPRLTVPYSSDFIVAGSRAREFLRVHPKPFLDKHRVAEIVEKKSQVPCRSLYEHDTLTLSAQGFEVKRVNDYVFNEHRVLARMKTKPNPTDRYSSINDEQFRQLFEQAVPHMLSKMKLESTWKFEIENSDTGTTLGVDLSNGQTYVGKGDENQEYILRCTARSSYINALLTFRTHWDNAMISYHLSWQRYPDEYDVGLYKAINFLHVPLKVTQ